MECNNKTLSEKEEEEEVVEEEVVLFDLDDVMGQVHIPANAPYVLSVGEYEETVGTCLVFDETEAEPVLHVETGPSEGNLFSGACIVDTTCSRQASEAYNKSKQDSQVQIDGRF